MDLNSDVIITFKWNGNEYKIENISETATVGDLKSLICAKTGVLPHRQKLMGLKPAGKLVKDDEKIVDLKLKANIKIMLVGSLESDVETANKVAENIPEILNDFDIEEEIIMVENRIEYLQKIEKRIKSYDLKILNEPRTNSKLLVLDIDYTLFDHRSVAERGEELMRPYLHEFLTTAYIDNYDIVIWSATSMKWIEAKMDELGVSKNTNYKICFMLDSLAMITVHVETYGVIEVKPLGVIWGKFEDRWGKHNTIMFDDLRRNFIMNPQSGLRIRAFRNAHTNRTTDKELKRLSKYLHSIAQLTDFSILDHSQWESYYRTHYKRDN